MLQGATAALFGGALIGMAALAGCADNGPPPGQPSFYHDLATTDADARRQRGAIDDLGLSQQ